MFSYGEFLLWNNEAITIEKILLFWKPWFKRNILFVQDIPNADGNFLTFEEFQNKFNIKTNCLHYFQLMAAIPSDLRKKARDPEVRYPYLPKVLLLIWQRCAVNIIMKYLTKTPQSRQPALKPGKSILPTPLQDGKPNSPTYVNQQEIINEDSFR